MWWGKVKNIFLRSRFHVFNRQSIAVLQSMFLESFSFLPWVVWVEAGNNPNSSQFRASLSFTTAITLPPCFTRLNDPSSISFVFQCLGSWVLLFSLHSAKRLLFLYPISHLCLRSLKECGTMARPGERYWSWSCEGSSEVAGADLCLDSATSQLCDLGPVLQTPHGSVSTFVLIKFCHLVGPTDLGRDCFSQG